MSVSATAPVPPPPPPPPATPGPTKPPRVLATESKSKPNQPTTDRGALLQSIQQGKKLKKTDTKDRSNPILSGKSNNSSIGVQPPVSSGEVTSGTGTVNKPSGLFANGFPKLKSTSLKDHSEIKGANVSTSKPSEGKLQSKSIHQPSRSMGPPPPVPPPSSPMANSKIISPKMDEDTIQTNPKIVKDKPMSSHTSPKPKNRPTSPDMKRLNENLFGSNTMNQGMSPTLKHKSSSATSEVLQSIKQGGNLKPTTHRGMKLDENNQVTKSVLKSYGPVSSGVQTKKSNMFSEIDSTDQEKKVLDKNPKPEQKPPKQEVVCVQSNSKAEPSLTPTGNMSAKKSTSESKMDDAIARANEKLKLMGY